MFINFRHRKKIQYALIIVTVLIQLFLLLFFYNEYFNVNKLRDLEKKISWSQQWNHTSYLSKQHLLNAQQSLGDYIIDPQKTHLDEYFSSIQKVVYILDSASQLRNEVVFGYTNGGQENLKTHQPKLKSLENLLDSLYKHPPKINISTQKIEVLPIEIETLTPKISVDAEIVKDSTPPKALLPRLKDAIQGHVLKSVDTVYITTVHQQLVDTTKLINNIDSTLSSVNSYYTQQLKKSQSQLQSLSQQNKKLFSVYNQLLLLSHQVIDNYDINIHALNDELSQSYQEQSSQNSLIRRYSILGLMILSILVLILMGYLITISFQYEKALRHAKDEIESNLKFKNRIIGMLSHEVRAPLNIINLFVKRIMRKTTDEEILSQLSSIKFTNNSLLLQTQQILSFSRNEEETSEQSFTPFNLFDEINSISQVFEPYMESAENTLISKNNVDTGLWVFSDRIKIHQLLINLLTNANKFTEKGDIYLCAQSELLSDGQVVFSVDIKDQGVGISSEDIDIIFKPYGQSQQWHNMPNLGVGLGLYLCKEIVASLNGDIDVNSDHHDGTTVSIRLLLDIFNGEV